MADSPAPHGSVPQGPVTRRDFLRAAAIATPAVGALAGCLNAQKLPEPQATRAAAPVAPAVAASPTGKIPGANDRLRFAIIGVGGNACGRGTDHLQNIMGKSKDAAMNVEMALVCDIYDKHLDSAKRLGNCAGVREWERVIEDKNVDCVVIATPDHWHAPMAIAAMKAGKDVYLEKPMTLTIEEARDVYRTSVATQRVLQVGVQGTSNGNIWGARELVQKGLLGKVLWSQTSYSRNSNEGEWNYPLHPEASPSNIIWDRFLGSAQKRDFSPERFFRWRKYWDYSGGVATDLHFHRLAPLHVILGDEFPSRAVAAGGVYIQKDGREVPDTFMTTLEYPSGHFIVMSSSMANDVGLPMIIRGHEATLFFKEGDDVEFDGEAEFRSQEVAREKFRKAAGSDPLKVEPRKRAEHMQNFIECVRSRKVEDLNCPARLGYQTMVGIKMGVDSFRTGRTVAWDAAKEETRLV